MTPQRPELADEASKLAATSRDICSDGRTGLGGAGLSRGMRPAGGLPGPVSQSLPALPCSSAGAWEGSPGSALKLDACTCQITHFMPSKR